MICDHSRDRRVFDGGGCKVCLDCGHIFEVSELCTLPHKVGLLVLPGVDAK